MFANRHEAGCRLAERLAGLALEHPVVYALPRGGLPVAAAVAARLAAPLEIVLVQKLGAPAQPELAIGAVVDGSDPTVVLHHDVVAELGVSPGHIATVTRRAIAEIERRRREFVAGRTPIVATGRSAIVVDDGVATGATAEADPRVPGSSTDNVAQSPGPVCRVDRVPARRLHIVYPCPRHPAA